VYAFDEKEDNYVLDNEGNRVIKYYKSYTPLRISPSNRLYKELIGCNAVLPSDTIDGYTDVFDVDKQMQHENASLLMFMKENVYKGCVWTFENDTYFGIYIWYPYIPIVYTTS